jgi:hypothetical protein
MYAIFDCLKQLGHIQLLSGYVEGGYFVDYSHIDALQVQ